MSLIYQDKIHKKGQRGNCLAACISSVLTLPLEDVPAFEEMAPGLWKEALNSWANSRGYLVLKTKQPDESGDLFIAVGQTVRGTRHAVVVKDQQMIHDPHPSGAGLTQIEYLLRFVPFPEITDHGLD